MPQGLKTQWITFTKVQRHQTAQCVAREHWSTWKRDKLKGKSRKENETEDFQSTEGLSYTAPETGSYVSVNIFQPQNIGKIRHIRASSSNGNSFMFKKNKFRKWSLICSRSEQKVRDKLWVLGGDGPKCLERRAISTSIFFPTQDFANSRALTNYLLSLLISKGMKEARNYGQKFDSVGFSLCNKVWGVNG